jgi:hypothetical protein
MTIIIENPILMHHERIYYRPRDSSLSRNDF